MLEIASICRIVVGDLLPLLAAIYSVCAVIAAIAWQLGTRRSRTTVCTAARPPVSILKPLYGDESALYPALRSFFVQDYPHYQLVFGVRRPDDAALMTVQRLCAEFPHRDVRIVVNPLLHGANNKVSNLINILDKAEHDYLVLSDSDIIAQPDYLSAVIAPLADAEVGIVTCLYRGRARANLWSRVGALFIDNWFGPSVKVAHLMRSSAFAFGASIAMRRSTLDAIGGFQSIRNTLADDFQLGVLTRQQGLRTVLSHHKVETVVAESSFSELVQHELRWMRTIRHVQPLSYAGLFTTMPLSVALIGMLSGGVWSYHLLLIIVAAMLALHLIAGNGTLLRRIANLWILPFRDVLTFSMWAFGFANRNVRWRDSEMQIERGGSIRPVPEFETH